jgi:hypothetical protein
MAVGYPQAVTDNALDACEEAEIAPAISIMVKRGSIVIEDNGPGIPTKTIEGVIDYNGGLCVPDTRFVGERSQDDSTRSR